MSVLQVYLDWASSLLSDRPVDSVAAIQDGKVLCQLIDILAPEAGLIAQVQASGTCTQRAHVQAALEHMKSHGVGVAFTVQDIIDGDIKSLLNVMWLVILNYGIHAIGTNVFQRTASVGKRSLLEWCQGQLDVAFNPQNTLAFNLCTGGYFSKLLHQLAGRHMEQCEDKVAHLHKLLQEIDERYGIKRTIINPNDILDGTVDEHTLMIYLSLLKLRAISTTRTPRHEMLSLEGKEVALAKVEERNRSLSEEADKRKRQSDAIQQQQQQLQRQQQQQLQRQQQQQNQQIRAVTGDKSPALTSVTRHAMTLESADAVFSDTNPLFAGSGEQVAQQRGKCLQPFRKDEDKDTDASQGHSERETESLSEFSSGALDEGVFQARRDPAVQTGPDLTARDEDFTDQQQQHHQQTSLKRPADSDSLATSIARQEAEKNMIRLKRPKDYYLQWEETLDRLSQPPQLTQGSILRSSRDNLPGASRSGLRSRSASSESEVHGSRKSSPAWQRDFLDRRSESYTPGTQYRRVRYVPPRSSSLPHQTVRQGAHQGRAGKGGDSSVTLTASPQAAEADGWQWADDQPLSQLSFNSTEFKARLQELKRSGRAQRVILPDLGPDAPVLMIPGQGEEVLLLFDALRQARAEVDHNMGRLGPEATAQSKKGESTAGTNPVGYYSRQSPSQQQKLQSDSATELTSVVQTVKVAGDVRDRLEAVPRRGPLEEEEADTVGGLPVASPYRLAKPQDLRVRNLQDPRRTRSWTERPVSTSPLVQAAEAVRFHSLSPRRENEILDLAGRVRRSPSGRIVVSSSANGVSGYSTRPFSGDRIPILPSLLIRSYSSSPVALKTSSSSSPYRPYTSSISPLRSLSPRTPSPQLEFHPEYLSRRSEDVQSPRSRAGGLGRVPRREAWERQRQRGTLGSYDSEIKPDSGAQAKFIEVLCKEIEDLKHKIELMEESSPERTSPNRPPPVYAATASGTNDTFYTSRSQIQETETKMVLAPRVDSPGPEFQAQTSSRQWEDGQAQTNHFTRHSHNASGLHSTNHSSTLPQRPQESDGFSRLADRDSTARLADRGSTSRVSIKDGNSGLVDRDRTSKHADRASTSRLADKAGSSRLEETRSSGERGGALLPPARHTDKAANSDREGMWRGRQSPSPDRYGRVGGTEADRTQTSTLPKSGRTSPVRSQANGGPRVISLGYKSPIRSVTQEIWGKDLTPLDSLDTQRKDNCKRLLSARSLSEEEVIELKQSLASAVVENDILQAKLNNARLEIQSKLSQTNEVLDDCRRHLAKSQAENMELRAALEREREQTERHETALQRAGTEGREVEEELRQALVALERSQPAQQTLRQDNSQLQESLAAALSDNATLTKELDELRKSHVKSVATVRELRNCLDEARQERSSLQLKVSQLERQQKEAKVKAIVSQYGPEKGAQDEAERELSSSGVSSSSERYRPSGIATYQCSNRKDAAVSRVTSAAAVPVSTSRGDTTFTSQPSKGVGYSLDDLTPVVPSSYREIYPHRKTSRYRHLSAERYSAPRRDSPVRFIDCSDLQHVPAKQGPESDSEEEEFSARDAYSRPRSPSPVPLRKPVPYRPQTGNDNKSTSFAERLAEGEATKRSTSPQQRRGRSPGRASAAVTARRAGRESRSSSYSPGRGVRGDKLGRSYDTIQLQRRQQRSASSSPRRYEAAQVLAARKGILKNFTSLRYPEDRSLSPPYRSSRTHSPPTRLSPENKERKGKKLSFTRTPPGQIARDLQRQFDQEDVLLEELRKKHSNTTSWFQLQLEDVPPLTNGVTEVVQDQTDEGEERVALSDEQRNYANELIKKYTGIKL